MKAGIYEHKELIDSLQEIAKLKGKIEYDEDAIKEYDKWYEEFRKTIAGDRTGVMGRLHSGVVKLSMILGVSRHYDLIVKKLDVEEAIANCICLIDNYSAYSLKVGKSDLALAGSYFIPEIWNAPLHQITKRDFLSKHWMDVSFENLDKLTTTLEQGGLIEVTLTGNDAHYKLTKKGLELWAQNEKNGKNGH